MTITSIGLDLAKSVFHVYAVNRAGQFVKKKELKRKQLLAYFANIEPCVIAMEACGGANYLGPGSDRAGSPAPRSSPLSMSNPM